MTKEIAQFKIIDDKKDEPTLEQAQQFVGGYVEGIEFPTGDYLIVNEEGKLNRLPFNEQATKLWRETFTPDKYLFGSDDFVVGNALLIKSNARNNW
jgi:hypothetical protein